MRIPTGSGDANDENRSAGESQLDDGIGNTYVSLS
jgi:hypothetical protein